MKVWKKMFIPVLVLSAVSLIFGCSTTGGTSLDEFTKAADANLEAYGECLVEGDIEGWLDLHTDDVMKMPQDAMPVVGIEALRKDITGGMQVVDILEFEAESEEHVVFGNYGYARGNYYVEQRLRETGEKLPRFEGKYLTVYKKDSDGIWKIYRDIYSSNKPAEH